MAAVSFNWALTATSYINIEKKRILECNNKKMSLIDKQVELKKRILSIEKNRENNFNLTEISKIQRLMLKLKQGLRLKKEVLMITSNYIC